MNDIRDKGITTGLQYDRWIASIRAKRARKSPLKRASEHPAAFCICVYLILACVAYALLDAMGAIQPFLGK